MVMREIWINPHAWWEHSQLFLCLIFKEHASLTAICKSEGSGLLCIKERIFFHFYYRVYLSISHPNTRIYWSHLTKRIGWRLKNINVWGHSSICRFLLILQILYIFLASKQQYLIIINLNARETGGEVERITQEIS